MSCCGRLVRLNRQLERCCSRTSSRAPNSSVSSIVVRDVEARALLSEPSLDRSQAGSDPSTPFDLANRSPLSSARLEIVSGDLRVLCCSAEADRLSAGPGVWASMKSLRVSERGCRFVDTPDERWRLWRAIAVGRERRRCAQPAEQATQSIRSGIWRRDGFHQSINQQAEQFKRQNTRELKCTLSS